MMASPPRAGSGDPHPGLSSNRSANAAGPTNDRIRPIRPVFRSLWSAPSTNGLPGFIEKREDSQCDMHWFARGFDRLQIEFHLDRSLLALQLVWHSP